MSRQPSDEAVADDPARPSRSEEETEVKVKQGIGNAMQVVLLAKDIITSAIQTVPQAALAWTGVSFALQILLNPAQETKANREGIVYIISRMDWYWKLSSLLLKENIVDGGSSAGLRCELKKRIVDLYKTLLSYQMKRFNSSYNKVISLYFFLFLNIYF